MQRTLKYMWVCACSSSSCRLPLYSTRALRRHAVQASGSFALSLLTGTPRSETASLLVLPSSHSGLLQLAMLDRGWLAAGAPAGGGARVVGAVCVVWVVGACECSAAADLTCDALQMHSLGKRLCCCWQVLCQVMPGDARLWYKQGC